MDNEINVLIKALPEHLYKTLSKHSNLENLLEIVLDYGRPPEARFSTGSEIFNTKEITKSDLTYVTKKIGKFMPDNRAGIQRTLHRISAIKNR